ncbi:MAG: Zn-dependent oligopeptidase [Phycisphaerales bacterium]|nr:Zn-dependent oligopeptidase [Phycisphaerales bacterium]
MQHDRAGRFVAHCSALVIAVITVSLIAQSSAIAQQGSAIDEWLIWGDEQIRKIIDIPDDKRTFENTVLAIDDIQVRVGIETEMLQFMPYVSPDPAEREAGELAIEAWSDWDIRFEKNEAIYYAVRAYADTNPRLTGERERLLDRMMRDYRREGMDLPADKRDRLREIELEHTKLSIEFDRNIRDDETTVLLSIDELDGVPDEFIANLDRIGGLVMVGMDYPTYGPIMDQCRNETTRRKLWLTRKRRGGQRNVDVLEKLIRLRAEKAHLLGYDNLVDYKTEVRMAGNAEAIRAFYDTLRPIVRKKSQVDYEQFLQAKRDYTRNPDTTIHTWDYGFYLNLLKKTEYALDEEKVRPYFPLDRVIDGLFSITQSLYGIEYRDVTAEAGTAERPLWHEDVRLFEVWDKATGRMLGEFYIDLHPRPNKYTGAAQWGIIPRKAWSDGTVNTPVAALVCNFTKPTADKPSLLQHDEVVTFFHEFGHLLHTILTEADIAAFSGTRVELDFVEMPSQMFENWAWDRDVLRTFARHYETSEPLPDELLDAMLAARNLASGMAAEFQIFLGTVDLAYHSDPDGEVDTTELGLQIYDDILVWDAVPGTYFQASFGHLTGYEAGYYGYQWSLVYACDMFQRFNDAGLLNPKAGMDYRKRVLAKGGTMDGMDIVREYLGREPDTAAFLKHLGLETE